VLASFSWGAGNIFSKKIGPTPPLALVVWGSLVAFPVVALLSLAVDGPDTIVASLKHMSWASAGAVAYIVYISTLVCYSLWSWLLNRLPTATIAPFTLLVPIFGFLGSVLILGETLPSWKILASLLVILGLCFNLLEPRLKAAFYR
jgi:O-acetylserine/cysteine efflux transporter